MAKTEHLRLRLTPDEKEAFEAAAQLNGVAVAAWVRERLRTAARRELVEAGMKVPFLQERLGERNA